MKHWIAISLSAATLAATLGACSKKDDKKADPAAKAAPESGGGAAGTAAAPDKKATPAAVMAWLPANTKQLWQGAAATRLTLRTSGSFSMAGDPAAIDVTGEKAIAFDGTAEHQLDFLIESPCSVGFKKQLTEGSMAGGTATFPKGYLVAGDKLLVADGPSGYRKGKTALACTSDGFVVVDDKGACVRWKKKFGDWEEKPETCAWSQADGKDVLTIGDTKLIASDGDTLQSEQFSDELKKARHQPMKDYAAAKEKVAAEVAEKAKGSGG